MAATTARTTASACAIALALASSLAAPGATAYDWLQFNGSPQHSGNNTFEAVLGAGNVNQLTVSYQVSLPGPADGVPAFLERVATAGGVKDLLFVTTVAGTLLALDAKTGGTVWSKAYANPYPLSSCLSGNPKCGTTSSPAIDPDHRYVYTYGLDGKVHKLQVGDGTEVLTGGWPQVTTLKAWVEKGSSALATATGANGRNYLYMTHSAFFGDTGDFQGHITAIDLVTGAQNVFNMMCGDQPVHFVDAPGTPDCATVGSGVWARPGAIYDAGTNRIFIVGGNQFNAAANNWGESVVALNPDGTGTAGKPVDTYTPTNHVTLDNGDIDMGSTAPAILPVPPNSNVQHLAVQGGKDAKLRLLNLANLNGTGAPGALGGEVGAIINVPQGGQVLTQPAVWVNPADGTTWVFVVNSSGASGLRLAVDGSGNPSLATQWNNTLSGASPLVANNVLYFASRATGLLRALNPVTGAVLFSSTGIQAVHWQSPLVANCALYVMDGAPAGSTGRITAYGLPALAAAQPARLAVASVNGGANPVAGTPFDVAVQVQDCNGNPVNLGSATAVQLVRGNGVGVLGGGTGCTIAAGTGTCTVTGATWSVAGVGVILTAARTSGIALGPGSSAPLTVLPSAVVPTLDIDASIAATQYDALTDGLLLIRYLFGLNGTALTNGVLGGTATRTDPAAIAGYLDSIRTSLDIDGNGATDALTDGLLLLRYLFGLRGSALVAGAVDPAGTRNTAPAVEQYIQSLMP